MHHQARLFGGELTKHFTMKKYNLSQIVKIILIVLAIGVIGNLIYQYSGSLGHKFGHWFYENASDHPQ